MDAIKAKAISEGTKTNDYQIFREVVGEPSHGCILGMGIGIKAKDVYGLTSSSKGCSKRCREDFTKEKEDLEARLREEMDSKLAKSCGEARGEVCTKVVVDGHTTTI